MSLNRKAARERTEQDHGGGLKVRVLDAAKVLLSCPSTSKGPEPWMGGPD
jgi:hypothetical protein